MFSFIKINNSNISLINDLKKRKDLKRNIKVRKNQTNQN